MYKNSKEFIKDIRSFLKRTNPELTLEPSPSYQDPLFGDTQDPNRFSIIGLEAVVQVLFLDKAGSKITSFPYYSMISKSVILSKYVIFVYTGEIDIYRKAIKWLADISAKNSSWAKVILVLNQNEFYHWIEQRNQKMKEE